MTFHVHDFAVGDRVAGHGFAGVVVALGPDGAIEIIRDDGARIWATCKGGKLWRAN